MILIVHHSSTRVGNHFFQTLAKMVSDILFKLANKYQINNTVMFNI